LIAVCAIHDADSAEIKDLIFQLRNSYEML